jgi:hypothetical protein
MVCVSGRVTGADICATASVCGPLIVSSGNIVKTGGQLFSCENINELNRDFFHNSNTGALTRKDIQISVGGGSSAIYMGVQCLTGSTLAYIDGRPAGGPTVLQTNGICRIILTDGVVCIGSCLIVRGTANDGMLYTDANCVVAIRITTQSAGGFIWGGGAAGGRVIRYEGDLPGFTGTAAACQFGMGVSAATQLCINNVGRVHILCSLGVAVAPNAQPGRIDASNDIVAFSSDRRLKDNIQTIQCPLYKLQNLSGFLYNWNKTANKLAGYETGSKYVGLYAQEVQSVLPEAVKLAPFDNDGQDISISGCNYLTVQYEKLVPLLVEAIKEQQCQIEELKCSLSVLSRGKQ